MGFLDKLKDVGKTVLVKAKSNTHTGTDVIYLDNFVKDGSIKSESLPQTKNNLYYSIDVEKTK